MADEPASGGAGRELPETEGPVPGRRKSVGAIRRNYLLESLEAHF